MTRRSRSPFVAALLTLAATVGSVGSAHAGQAPSGAAVQAALAESVPRWEVAMDTLHVPGMAVAVVGPDGVLFTAALGQRDLERGLPTTPDTLFYIASMTKPFVATATALLEADGTIDLNRPVRTYLPRLRLADFTETITITVRDLLAHRRGIDSYPITFGEAFTGQMTEDRFYRLLTRVEAVGELDYTNLHYTLLGRLVEAVTGDDWKTRLQREVLAPAGMTRTTPRVAPLTEDPDAAVGYEHADGAFRPARRKTDRTMHAAGGLLSTASELARWLRIQLGEGRLDGRVVVPAETIREMLKPQIYEDDPSPLIPDHRRIGFGLGWDIHEDRGARVYYHGGQYVGWRAHMSFMPEAGVGVVVLLNARHAMSEMVAAEIYDRLRGLEPRDVLPRLIELSRESGDGPSAPAATDDAGPSGALELYAGTYENDDWGALEVRVEAGDLTARIGDLPLPLVWTGRDAFIADEDSPGRFEIDGAGEVVAIELGALAAEGNVRFARQAR